jgi:hypothetical protein
MYASAYCSDECTFAQTAASRLHQQRKEEAAAAARLRAASKPETAGLNFACTLCGRLFRSKQSLCQHAPFCKLAHERRRAGSREPRARKRFKVRR